MHWKCYRTDHVNALQLRSLLLHCPVSWHLCASCVMQHQWEAARVWCEITIMLKSHSEKSYKDVFGVGVLMNTHSVQQFSLGWWDICCFLKWTQQKFWMVGDISWWQDNVLMSAHSELFLCFFEQVYPQNCVIQLFIKWRKIFSNPGLSPSGMRAPVRQHTQTDKDSSRRGYGYEVNLNLSQRGEKWRKNMEKLPVKRVLKWQCAASVNSVLITFCQKLTFIHALCLVIGFLSHKINIFFFLFNCQAFWYFK